MELKYRCETVNGISSKSVSGSDQAPSDNRTGAGEIHDPPMAMAECGHDLAPVLDARCACPCDDCRGRLFNLGLLELSRQEAVDDGDLVTFSLREVGAITLVPKSDRFAAPLDHRLRHLLDLSFGNVLDICSPPGGQVALIQLGQHQTQRPHR